MLEFWLPFEQIEYSRNLGIWCDGIRFLQVANINRTAFSVSGVGYFPDQLSPFELGFYYKNRRDLLTTKVTFLFGMLDCDGHLRMFPQSLDIGAIHAQRPRRISDWAVAVELTPYA